MLSATAVTPLNLIDAAFQGRTFSSLARERILHYFVRYAGLSKLIAQLLVLCDGHFSQTHQHRGLRVLKLFGESVEIFCFCALDFIALALPPFYFMVEGFVQQNSRTHR